MLYNLNTVCRFTKLEIVDNKKQNVTKQYQR